MRPNVSVSILNGGLNLANPSENGTSVLLVASPLAPVAGYGVAFLCRNKKEVETAFAQAGNEAVVTAINKGFYAEAPEGTKLYVLAMAPTTTLKTLVSAANANKPLNLATSQARLLAAVKFPSGAYVPEITDGFDTDVHNAVVDAQTLADAWLAQKRPFRFFIEGFAFAAAAAAKDYSTDNKRNGAIIVGKINDSTAQLTLLAMGRAASGEPQQNIGRIKSGALKIAETAVVKIGANTIELTDTTDLETLHTKRYIVIERNEIGTGYVFNDDNMLTEPADDFNNLANGRVIDNATRVAYLAYYQELKDDVFVDEDGRLNAAAEKALETKIEMAIANQMSGQLSQKKDGSPSVKCLVNPDANKYAALYASAGITNPNFNILQTNTVYIFLQVQPKGCLKYINVYLGLTSNLN